MGQWYVLTSRDELMTAGYLSEAGYLAYVPCETVERKVRREKIPVRRPLVPGYVFVHCSERAFSAVRAIGASDDFVRYLNEQEVRVPLAFRPMQLAPLIWAELFGDFDHTRVPPPWKPERGDSVRIKAGMWKGYIGTILSVGKKALIETKWCKLEALTGDLELAA